TLQKVQVPEHAPHFFHLPASFPCEGPRRRIVLLVALPAQGNRIVIRSLLGYAMRPRVRGIDAPGAATGEAGQRLQEVQVYAISCGLQPTPEHGANHEQFSHGDSASTGSSSKWPRILGTRRRIYQSPSFTPAHMSCNFISS